MNIRETVGGWLLDLHDKICPCDNEWSELEVTVYGDDVSTDGDISKEMLTRWIQEGHGRYR